MSVPSSYYSTDRPLGVGNPFDATGFNRLRNEVGEIRDKLDRLSFDAKGAKRGGDFGIARLDEDLETTDTEVDIVGYTPILGAATPGDEPATVGNANELEGNAGDTVIVVLTGDGWQVAVVLEFEVGDAEHGFCRPYEDFTDEDTEIRPAGYQSVEGVESPDDETESVTNDGFSARTTDTLAVAKRGGVWQVCYVIKAAPPTVRYGVVSGATAAEWDNGSNTLTLGAVDAWEFDESNQIDRDGETVELILRWTEAPVEGSLIGWIGEEIVVMTCGPLKYWAAEEEEEE